MKATRHSMLLAAAVGAVLVLSTVGCDNAAARRAAVERAKAQVERLAAELDQRTTASGVYVRVKDGEIQERDPWGAPLQVHYAEGGVAEVVTVRSAGPDREFHTADDLVAQGLTANLKGIGEGIKKNTEEMATKAGRGLVKGVVEGVKESVQDALPFKKQAGGSRPKIAEDRQDERSP